MDAGQIFCVDGDKSSPSIFFSVDARSAAERQIFALLQAQIDQFLELADYDWIPAEPKSDAPPLARCLLFWLCRGKLPTHLVYPSPLVRTDSSEYIFDMLAYLTTIFASLTNLPVRAEEETA